MADGNITVEVSTQDAQKRLLRLHRENARLRRRIMTDAVTSDEAASIVASLAQSLADARAEIDRLNNVLVNYRASHDALRGWAQECRDQVLYLLAQQDNELGRVAEGLGQSSAGLLGPDVEFSGVPAGHSSNHPAGGTSAGTQG